MNNDDALCGAAQRAYSAALETARSIPQNDRNNGDPNNLFYEITNFEAWPNPMIVRDFTTVGLQPIGTENDLPPDDGITVGKLNLFQWPTGGLMKIPVFNDGMSHWMEFSDHVWAGNTYSTDFVLLKDGITKQELENVMKDSGSLTFPSNSEISSLIVHYPFGIGIESNFPIAKQFQSVGNYAGVGYPLRDWPDYQKLMSKWNMYSSKVKVASSGSALPSAPNDFFPVLTGPISQRAYNFSGKIYFIADQYLPLDTVRTVLTLPSLVAIYQMEPLGPVDKCYVNLSLSGEKNLSLSGEKHHD